MHNRKSHGGYAAQAVRRGEEYVLCGSCGQRRHPRTLADVDLDDLEWYEEERISLWRLAGLTVFCLVMFLAVLYAGPIVLAGLSGV